MKCPKCQGIFKSLYTRNGAKGVLTKVGYICKECKYLKLKGQ